MEMSPIIIGNGDDREEEKPKTYRRRYNVNTKKWKRQQRKMRKNRDNKENKSKTSLTALLKDIDDDDTTNGSKNSNDDRWKHVCNKHTPANVNMQEQMVYYEKLGMFDMLRSLRELTPSRAELKEPYVREFMDGLINAKDDRYGHWAVPNPEYSAHVKHPIANVIAVHPRPDIKDKYKFMFGFLIFVDPEYKFVRANAHVWLANKNDPKDILDPSPLTDPTEPTKNQYYLASTRLFTVAERLKALLKPDEYSLGAITNKAIIPECLLRQLHVKISNESIGITADQHRLILCKRIDGEHTVKVNVAKRTFDYLQI